MLSQKRFSSSSTSASCFSDDTTRTATSTTPTTRLARGEASESLVASSSSSSSLLAPPLLGSKFLPPRSDHYDDMDAALRTRFRNSVERKVIALATDNDADGLITLYNDPRMSAVRQDNITLSWSIISTLARLNRPMEALSYLKELRTTYHVKADINAYHAIMIGLSRTNEVSAALDTFDLLYDDAYFPGPAFVSPLMHLLLNEQAFEHLLQIYEVLLQDKVDIPPLMSLQVMKAAGLIQPPAVATGVAVFQRVMALEQPLTRQLCEAFARLLGQTDDSGAVMDELRELMATHQITMTPIVYRSAAVAYMKAGMWEKAQEMFTTMMLLKMPMTVDDRGSHLLCCGRLNRQEDLLDAYERYSQYKVHFKPDSMVRVMRSYATTNRHEKLKAFYLECCDSPSKGSKQEDVGDDTVTELPNYSMLSSSDLTLPAARFSPHERAAIHASALTSCRNHLNDSSSFGVKLVNHLLTRPLLTGKAAESPLRLTTLETMAFILGGTTDCHGMELLLTHMQHVNLAPTYPIYRALLTTCLKANEPAALVDVYERYFTFKSTMAAADLSHGGRCLSLYLMGLARLNACDKIIATGTANLLATSSSLLNHDATAEPSRGHGGALGVYLTALKDGHQGEVLVTHATTLPVMEAYAKVALKQRRKKQHEQRRLNTQRQQQCPRQDPPQDMQGLPPPQEKAMHDLTEDFATNVFSAPRILADARLFGHVLLQSEEAVLEAFQGPPETYDHVALDTRLAAAQFLATRSQWDTVTRLLTSCQGLLCLPSTQAARYHLWGDKIPSHGLAPLYRQVLRVAYQLNDLAFFFTLRTFASHQTTPAVWQQIVAPTTPTMTTSESVSESVSEMSEMDLVNDTLHLCNAQEWSEEINAWQMALKGITPTEDARALSSMTASHHSNSLRTPAWTRVMHQLQGELTETEATASSIHARRRRSDVKTSASAAVRTDYLPVLHAFNLFELADPLRTLVTTYRMAQEMTETPVFCFTPAWQTLMDASHGVTEPTPRSGYTCRRCNVPGHWVHNCTLR